MTTISPVVTLLAAAALLSLAVIITDAGPDPRLVEASNSLFEQLENNTDLPQQNLGFTELDYKYKKGVVLIRVPGFGWSLYIYCLVTGNRTLVCQSLQRFSVQDVKSSRVKVIPKPPRLFLESDFSDMRVVRAMLIKDHLGTFYENDILWKIILNRDIARDTNQVQPVSMHTGGWSQPTALMGGPNFRCGVHFFKGLRVEVYDKSANIFNIYMDSNECPPSMFGNFVFEDKENGAPTLLGLVHGTAGEPVPGSIWQFQFELFNEKYWLSG